MSGGIGLGFKLGFSGGVGEVLGPDLMAGRGTVTWTAADWQDNLDGTYTKLTANATALVIPIAALPDSTNIQHSIAFPTIVGVTTVLTNDLTTFNAVPTNPTDYDAVSGVGQNRLLIYSGAGTVVDLDNTTIKEIF